MSSHIWFLVDWLAHETRLVVIDIDHLILRVTFMVHQLLLVLNIVNLVLIKKISVRIEETDWPFAKVSPIVQGLWMETFRHSIKFTESRFKFTFLA